MHAKKLYMVSANMAAAATAEERVLLRAQHSTPAAAAAAMKHDFPHKLSFEST
jgi:hypothetical protein